MATTEEVREAQRIEKNRVAFDRFMAKQETKLMVSLVPESNPPEAVTALLRAAFDAGATCGASDVLSEIFSAMLKSPPRDA